MLASAYEMTPSENNEVEVAESSPRRFDPTVFERVVVALIALFVVLRTAYLLAVTWPFTTDDAYITLRYARHLAEGHGIAWNVGGEPVEGYSNFLFVILGAAAMKIGADPVLFLKILCCLSLALTSVLLFRMARPWVGPIGATLPAAMLTLYEGTIFWTVSGLETAVYQMLVVASVAAFFEAFRPGEQRGDSTRLYGSWRKEWLVVTGLLVFVVGLTRPEGPLIGIAMGIALTTDFARRVLKAKGDGGSEMRTAEVKRGLRAAAALGLSFAIPYGIYFGWRYGYYGRILPNSFYCKMSFDGDPLILIKDFWSTAWPAFGLAGAGLLTHWRRLDARVLVLVLAVVSYLLVFYGVDPLISRMNRHFLTAFGLLLILAVTGLFGLTRLLLPRIPGYLSEFAVMFWILVGTAMFVPAEGRVLQALAVDYEKRMALREELGRWLDARLGPDDAFVIGDAGMVPYVARAKVIDAYCLNNAAMTRPPIDRSPAKFAEYILEQAPAMIVVHSKVPDRLDPHTMLGVFPSIVENSTFSERYTHVESFTRGMFNYWIFERIR